MDENQRDASSLNENALRLNGPHCTEVCSVCGQDHDTEQCSILKDFKLVGDTQTISRARLTLPSNLEVQTLADGSTTVVASAKFEQGTQFGPFQAPLTLHMHPAVSFPLKVFPKNSKEGLYLDTTDEESCNWMCLVAAATSSKQQNLICYDIKQSIFFTTTRDVLPGDELRVWYALYYGLKLQALPLADDSVEEEAFWTLDDQVEQKLPGRTGVSSFLGNEPLEVLAQHLPSQLLGAEGDSNVWKCKLCGKQELKVASFARHLMSHHQRPRHGKSRAQCDVCSKLFCDEQAVLLHKKCKHDKNHLSKRVVTSPAQLNVQDLIITKLCPDFKEGSHLTSSCTKTHNEEHVTLDDEGGNLVSVEGTKNLMSLADISSLELQNLSITSDSAPIIDKYDDLFKEKRISCLEDTAMKLDVNNISLNSLTSLKSQSLEEGVNATNSTGPNVKAVISSLSGHNGSKPPFSHPEEGSLLLNLVNNIPTFFLSTSKPDSTECVGKKETSDLTLSSMSEIFVQTEDSSLFPSTYTLDDAEGINLSLENGQQVALILINSSQCDDGPINKSKNGSDGGKSDDIDMFLLRKEENANHISCDENSGNQHAESSPQGLKKLSFFSCDICNKSFEKSNYLYRHLRKHTGEFTCVTCLAVFARKENLQAHSCSRPMAQYPCPSCGKKFSAKRYLQRHIPLHTGEFTCSYCKRRFVSRLSLKAHQCSKESEETQQILCCFLCQRPFMTQVRLQAHLRRHYIHSKGAGSVPSKSESLHLTPQKLRKTLVVNNDPNLNENSSNKDFVCEVCGVVFKSCSGLKTHRTVHGEKRFKCEICNKRFYRKDVLQDHLSVHQTAKLPCHICGKKYKTKKSLDVHMVRHNGAKRFACGKCGRQFYQKGNLLKHEQTHAKEREFLCQYCNKKFTSKEYFNIHVLEHTQGKIFTCDICKKSFVKKHLLESHHQLYHSNRAFLCKFCNSVMRHRHSARRHLEMRHSNHRQDWTVPGFLDTLLTELPESILYPTSECSLQPHLRQQLLQSIREEHFKSGRIQEPVMSEDPDSTSDFIYTVVPPSDSQVDQLAQGGPLIMLQPTKQSTVFDSYLSDIVSQPSSSHPPTASSEVQADEILLTMIESDTSCNSNVKDAAISEHTSNDIISFDQGATYIMGDGAGNESVFYYVVEAGSNVLHLNSEKTV